MWFEIAPLSPVPSLVGGTYPLVGNCCLALHVGALDHQQMELNLHLIRENGCPGRVHFCLHGTSLAVRTGRDLRDPSAACHLQIEEVTYQARAR